MSQIILHHYPASPFAEKVRAILGSRNLAWRSVHIPAVMPKPDVVALTGGYRKTPILQMGADVYCDTALIARKLDALSDEATLFPVEHMLTAQSIATWGDSILFPIAVALVFQPAVIQQRFSSEEEVQTFVADRAALRKNGHQRRITLAEANTVFDNCLRDYSRQLADGRQFLLGPEPTIADFSVYHPLWFVRNAAIVSQKFAPYPEVIAWMDRVAALGHGKSEELSSTEAIAIAKAANTVVRQTGSDLEDIAVGDAVEVAPADYGMDPTGGTLLLANHEEIVVQRRDERAGEVAVHFPRFCYSVRKLD
ncbi:glutathione S-transferase family protein [Gilvimarinus sp. F26214L]|uniref:glutathione S-transferase family protein n=1 Tax=Gilvimarinus sp. DZF01 TaxID=3461371 RepID=UPI004045EF6D